MRVKSNASRHVHLSLSNFEADPADLIVDLTAPDIRFRRKGDFIKQEQGRPAAHSSINVFYGFDGSVVWDEAFKGLVETLGGMICFKQFLMRVNAADQHVHFQTPVRGSNYQDNNFVSRVTLDALQDLNLWLGFDFSDFDPSDPTHLDPREAEGWDNDA